jgi:glycosyltransferase involved in cell wall biosynthesis
MKIIYIGQKNLIELISRLTKKGHSVLAYLSFWRMLFQDCNIVHWEPSRTNWLFFLAKIFKRKTVFITAKIPIGINIKCTKNWNYLKKWNLQKKGYILYAGPLAKRQGVHNLIETFKKMEDEHLERGKKLVLVGDEFQNKDYFNELKKTARSRENIIFIGRQTGEVLEQLFSHCYFFIQPSESKNISQTILEAMACGSAVLVSDAKKKLKITESEVGLFFRSNNQIDLENKMVTLINNPLAVKEMGENAKKIIEKKYSWDYIAEEMENLYRDKLMRKGEKIFFTKITKTNEGNI